MNMVMKASIPEEMGSNHKSQISHWKGLSWQNYLETFLCVVGQIFFSQKALVENPPPLLFGTNTFTGCKFSLGKKAKGFSFLLTLIFIV